MMLECSERKSRLQTIAFALIYEFVEPVVAHDSLERSNKKN